MSSIHTPQRLDGESFADYRRRRAASHAAVRIMTKGPTQAPAIGPLDTSRFFLGQHTNDERNRQRRRVNAWGGRRQYLKTVKGLRRVRADVLGAAS